MEYTLYVRLKYVKYTFYLRLVVRLLYNQCFSIVRKTYIAKSVMCITLCICNVHIILHCMYIIDALCMKRAFNVRPLCILHISQRLK